LHTRLTWICYGPTSANREGRFPLNEQLEQSAIDDTRALSERLQHADRVASSPALAALQTADILSLAPATDPKLADLDYGRWKGRSLADLQSKEPQTLMQWLADPEAAPHGGESLARLQARVADWMAEQQTFDGHVIAIANATVIRAAILYVMKAPPASFWLADIEPLALLRMTYDGRRWALRFGR
jgi:broad specificity phosphatase PhoE